MKNKITLIYPGEKEKLSKIKANIPLRLPLSILSLTPFLEKEDFEVKILDMRVSDYHECDFSDNLCVGISAKTGPEILFGLEVAKYVKNQNPDVRIVWGGIHASIFPEQTVENKYLDVVVKGEGEISFLEVVKKFQENKSYEDVKGISYCKNGNVISNPNGEFIDMENLPRPGYHLIDLKNYYNIQNSFDYQSSRGCPYKCKFCYNLSFSNRRWRKKSVETVINDLEYLRKEYDINKVEFIDDIFFVNKNRVRNICEQLIKNNIKISWTSSCRVDDFSKYESDFIRLLKESGCHSVLFGAESGSPAILDFIEKEITVEHIEKAVKKAAAGGINPIIGFIAGFPNETRQDVEKTINIISKLKKIDKRVEVNGCWVYCPYPGTPLFDISMEKGLKVPDRLEDWAQWSFNTVTIPWLDKKYTAELMALSSIVRFQYFCQEYLIRSKGSKLEVLIFKAINFPLNLLAKYRLNNKKFNYAFEWRAWSFLVRQIVGHS
tara:strand:+ start:1436 stop:2911 length:1476 start_codon:yes stop_codon:yes gene_type:complete